MFLKSPKYFCQCFPSPIVFAALFFYHQILVVTIIVVHFRQNDVAERVLNHQFWHISPKFCGKRQIIKMFREEQGMNKKDKGWQRCTATTTFVHLLESIDERKSG